MFYSHPKAVHVTNQPSQPHIFLQINNDIAINLNNISRMDKIGKEVVIKMHQGEDLKYSYQNEEEALERFPKLIDLCGGVSINSVTITKR